MRGEQRRRQSVDAKGDAGGVGGRAVIARQAPGLAEMVAVVVEAHAGGRRSQPSAPGPSARTSAPARPGSGRPSRRRGRRTGRSPDRCVRRGRARRRNRRRAPSMCRGSRVDRLGRADEDEFAHAERLQAVDVARRLAAEAVGGDVEDQPVARDGAASRGQRIDRIAGRRREHEVARLEAVGPGAARLEALDRRADRRVAAAERADAAEQMRKALQIAGLLDQRAADDRREANDLGARVARAVDQRAEPVDDLLIGAGAAVDAVDAGRMEQRLEDLFRESLRAGRGDWARGSWRLLSPVARGSARSGPRSSAPRDRRWRECGRC